MSLYRIDKLFNYEKGSLQSTKCIPGEYNFLTASAEWKTHSFYTHDCESLVFAAAASGSLGRTHYVNGKFIASDLCFILTPKDPINFPIDLKFYHIIFNLLRDDIVKNTKAGTSKEAIGLTSFGRYELPYFDIDHQEIVKEQFGNITEIKNILTEEHNHQSNFLTQLRQAFLREAMQGKLVPQNPNDEPASELLERIKEERAKLIAEGKIKKQKPLPEINTEEIPFQIPQSWTKSSVGEVADHCLGKMLDGIKNKGTLQPYLRNINIRWMDFYFDDLLKMRFEDHEEEKYGLKYGDVLICEGGEPGRAAIWRNQIPNMKIQKAIHRVRFYEGIDNEYFLYYLIWAARSKYLSNYFTGAGIQHFTGKSLARLIIPLPPLAEQQRIVSKLNQLMQFCEQLEQNINTTKEQTNLLLQTVLREALEEKGKGIPIQ